LSEQSIKTDLVESVKGNNDVGREVNRTTYMLSNALNLPPHHFEDKRRGNLEQNSHIGQIKDLMKAKKEKDIEENMV
jgi:hypothetical protein